MRSRRTSCLIQVGCLIVLISTAKADSSSTQPVHLPVPTDGQVASIAAMLPKQPMGVGRPISDRDAWSAVSQSPYVQQQLKYAATCATQPEPVLTEQMYYDYYRTGDRGPFLKPFELRLNRLNAFVTAECVENKGKYLPLIETELDSILSEYSWVEPFSHSTGNPQEVGTNRYGIDLATAARALGVATTDYWLGDKLKPRTRQRIREELHERVLDPYEATIKSGIPAFWWMTADNNWNSVCTAGVLGTALTIIDSANERALFVQGAEESMPYYVSGLGTDGYCFEGSGYWCYGFGNYLRLAETLYDQTQGKINLFQGERLRACALYMKRLELVSGLYPAFGDAWRSKRGSFIPQDIMVVINARWGMGWTELQPTYVIGYGNVGIGIAGFPLPEFNKTFVAGSPASPDELAPGTLRDFFKDSSVLVTRSQRPGAPDLELAVKGGDTGHNHGHNDNGTYVVSTKGMALVVDPGMEIYTGASFGNRRYEVSIMNSYGHDVPYVGKTLQKGGKTSLGKITNTSFTMDRDTETMDLTTSYKIPTLTKLTRTYVLDRTKPSVEIDDTADFSKPTDFGDAFITGSLWKENGPGSFLIYDQDSAVQGTVTLEDASQTLTNKIEPITAHQLPPGYHPVRLGFNLNKPAMHVVMHILIVPVSDSNQAK